jgi:hypothetical protein
MSMSPEYIYFENNLQQTVYFDPQFISVITSSMTVCSDGNGLYALNAASASGIPGSGFMQISSPNCYDWSPQFVRSASCSPLDETNYYSVRICDPSTTIGTGVGLRITTIQYPGTNSLKIVIDNYPD